MSDAAIVAADRGNENSPANACLRPLLSALNWEGDARRLCEVLPDRHYISDFRSLRRVLGNLDYSLVPFKSSIGRLTDDALPALLHTPDGDVWVIIEHKGTDTFFVFKGSQSRLETVETHALKGELFLIRPAATVSSDAELGRFGWIGSLLERQKSLVRTLFGLTLLVNCMALALPVYMLSVYDLAIGARSMPTLITLGGAMAIIIIAEIALRDLRSRAIARFAVHSHMSIMEAVFDRISRLPIAFVENASLSGQMNRLRAFESFREIFSGPLAVSMLDLPFIVIFIGAVFVIGGSLGWLVVAFVGVLTILCSIYIPRERVKSRKASIARSETRIFRKDMNSNLSTIRSSGAERIWEDRYAGLIARQAATDSETQRLVFNEQTLAQGLSAMIGAMIVGLGTVGVIGGELSIGALTAVMAIVWRVLAPVQSVLLNLNRLFQAIDTAKQLNQLMLLQQESRSISQPDYQKIIGRIELENVAYRGSGQGLPLLRGISMGIEPGELVVLAGAPGPSRSALLKLVANLHQPSGGRIRIDGFDARQFDVRTLRQRMALLSDDQIVFSGSLAHNFWLVNPLAEDLQISEAIKDADLEDFVNELEDGIATDLTGLMQSGLNATVLQKIRLARAYVQDPSVYLFDEPVKDLNTSGRRAFINKLYELKGKATVLVRTSDEDIWQLADTIATFHAGQLTGLEQKAGASDASKTDQLRSLLDETDPEAAKRFLSV